MLKRVLAILLIVCFCMSSICVRADTPALELTAKSAILIEQSSGKVLFEKNPDERLPLASVTKVMTMLLTMEAIESGKFRLQILLLQASVPKVWAAQRFFLIRARR